MNNSVPNNLLEVLARPPIALAYFVLAMAVIPLNDSLIKLMSDRFSVFEIMAIRAVIALFFVMLVPMVWSSIARINLVTWLKLFVRGFCLVGAMLFFFLPLATLSLAEVTAIFYTAPLLITLMSVPLLGERLGINRIFAVICGMVGVLIIVKPGSNGFEASYLMPVASAVSYSAYQLITRYIRNEAEVPAMVAAQNIIYLVTGLLGVSVIFLVEPSIPDGQIWHFLLRPWQSPTWVELGLLTVAALIVLNLSIASTNVYANVEATYVAPFEYVALPMAVMWGVIIWSDWPDAVSWLGISLILSSGIFMIYRENYHQKTLASSIPMRASATNAVAPVDDDLLIYKEYEPLPWCF